MRNAFAAIFMLLLSTLVSGTTTNLRSFDITGRYNACVVADVDSTQGRVACWGRNHFPVFLDGYYQKAFLPILLPEFKAPVAQVAPGLFHICVLLTNGEVQCWGDNPYGQLGIGNFVPTYSPTTVILPQAATKIFPGYYNTCAQLVNGNLYCWGDNYFGQLGLGHNNQVPTPQQVPFSNVIAMQLSRTVGCLIDSSKNVHCSGQNDNLALGVPVITNSNVFVSNGVTNANQLDVGTLHACAVLATGQIKCWGTGSSAQMGNGTTTLANLPTFVSNMTTAVEVSNSLAGSCARHINGTVSCWGSNNLLFLGSVGAGALTPRLATGITNTVRIRTGDAEACAQHANDTMTCWGRGSEGILGDGGSARNRLGASVNFTFANTYKSFQSITLGADLTFGIFSNGIVRSTGDNAFRQLGFGSTGQSSGAASVTTFIETSAIAPSSQIQVGSQHACSVKVGGGIECWGRNTGGQVGSSSYGSLIPDPIQVYPTGVVQKLQTMAFANCALLVNGTVECWGSNSQGQLGDGGVTSFTHIPQAVPGLTSIIDLSCAKFGATCCATKNDNSKRCWGLNNIAQLGIEPTGPVENSPKVVEWGTDSISVAMGPSHSCYINNAGKVFCFGQNTAGTLGDGTFFNSTKPKEVLLPGPASEIKTAISHSCATLQDSRIFCWGNNSNCAVGSELCGSNQYVNKPVQVMEDVIAFDVGTISTCALDSKKTLWCWGSSIRGSFGDSTTGTKFVPTRILYKK